MPINVVDGVLPLWIAKLLDQAVDPADWRPLEWPCGTVFSSLGGKNGTLWVSGPLNSQSGDTRKAAAILGSRWPPDVVARFSMFAMADWWR